MALTLQCPHFFSISGIQYGCMLGKFPCNCEICDCPDKYYVETKVISSFATLDSISDFEQHFRKAMEE